jgi:hypothetical protein
MTIHRRDGKNFVDSSRQEYCFLQEASETASGGVSASPANVGQEVGEVGGFVDPRVV